MRNLTAKFITLLILLLPCISNAQFKIPPRPEKQTTIYDYADVLNEADEKALTEKLLYYADSTSNQIVIVTAKTISGENIGLLTPKWAHEWGIGQTEKDNGVFILLAEKERSIWISPGYGVEDKLTAGQVGEITRNIIIPEFKAGSYYDGLDKGTDEIIALIGAKYVEERVFSDVPLSEDEQTDGTTLGFIVLGIFVALFVGFIFLVIWAVKRGGKADSYTYTPRRETFAAGVGTGFILSELWKLADKPPLKSGSPKSSATYTSSATSTRSNSRSSSGFGGGFGGGGFSGGGAGGSW